MKYPIPARVHPAPGASLYLHCVDRACVALLKYLAALLLVTQCYGAHACPVENAVIAVTINGHRVNAEVATNEAGHMCGLAFRHELPADRGMLFAYTEDQVLGFWMKDTYIDLSIAFMDSEGRILEIHAMDADQPSRRYISKQPGRYALEVNQGWFADNGIKTGDRMEFNQPANVQIYKH